MTPESVGQYERDRHIASGHAQYASWCEHCVFGSGREDVHATVHRDSDIPRLVGDYGFLSEDGPVKEEDLVALNQRKKADY